MPGFPRTPPGLAVLALAAVLLTTVAILGGLSFVSNDPSGATADPSRPVSEPTPLADYDTSTLRLTRGAFCDRLNAETIARALGGSATETTDWQPGERLPESQQISNEFGCSWSAGSVSVRAWVFAPPITPGRAADFTDESVRQACTRVRGAPPLGSPSLTQQCRTEAGTGLTGIYGLVGDSWVGCEIDGTDQSDRARPVEHVGEWCVAVLEALSLPRSS